MGGGAVEGAQGAVKSTRVAVEGTRLEGRRSQGDTRQSRGESRALYCEVVVVRGQAKSELSCATESK